MRVVTAAVRSEAYDSCGRPRRKRYRCAHELQREYRQQNRRPVPPDWPGFTHCRTDCCDDLTRRHVNTAILASAAPHSENNTT
eukprot:657843-Pleurochrysis_carterae.AAC.4